MSRYPTVFHLLAAEVRKVAPQVNRLRGTVTAVVTPFLWSKQTGHWRSCLRRKAVDVNGNAIPWYTYPAVDFLSTVDFSGRRILELGAGQSTLWWAARAEHVTALEGDAQWFRYLQAQAPENVSLYFTQNQIPPSEESIKLCESHAPFDVIIIDGLDRSGFAELVGRWLKPHGAIIFDNAEGKWSHNGTRDWMKNFRSFQQVGFYGYSPNNSLPHCTTIFFTESFLFKSQSNLVPTFTSQPPAW